MVYGVYSYIQTRYPSAVRIVNENQVPEIDNLYVDIGYVINLSSAKTNAEPKTTDSSPDQSGSGSEKFTEKIIPNVLRYIEVIFYTLCPKKLLFLSMEGTLPWTKVAHLRNWRRITELKGKQTYDYEVPHSTRAGTDLSAELCERLKEFIAHKISTDKKWETVEVILSGYQVPGQSNFKIMQYVRWLRGGSRWTPNTRHCVFTNNFECVVYGLALHEPYFALIERCEEYMYTLSGPEEMVFSFCYLSAIRGYIEQELCSLKDKIPFEYNLENIIDDWIVLCSLWGTDCVNSIPGCLGRAVMNHFPAAYSKALPQMEGYINDGGVLHLDRLEKLLKEIQNIGPKAPVSSREDYYYKHFGFSSPRKDLIKNVVQEYVKGIQYFIYKIFGTIPSWSWYYPYHYPPLIEDFHDLTTISTEFETDSPPDIFVPLVACLKGNRAIFVPSAFRNLVESDESPVKKYFPTNVEADPLMKKIGPSTIEKPLIDQHTLSTAMEPYYKNLTEDEQKRRTIEPLLIFDFQNDPKGADSCEHIRQKDSVRVRKIFFELVPQTQMTKGLYPGTKDNIHIGYPFFRCLDFTAEKDEKYLRLQVKQAAIKADLLRRPYVFADWPQLIPVKPSFLTDGREKYRWDGTQVIPSPAKRQVPGYLNFMKSKAVMADTKLALFASPYLGAKPLLSVNGEVTFEHAWNPIPYAFTAQTVVTECPLIIPHLPPNMKLAEYIPLQSKVFLLSQPYYGSEAEVISWISTTEVEVKVRTYKLSCKLTKNADLFKRMSTLAKENSIPYSVLSSITDRLYVKDVDVGLKLKFTFRDHMRIAEYTKQREGRWYFSQKAEAVIKEYIKQFPEILKDVKDCSLERLQEMSEWVKTQSYHTLKVSTKCERLEDNQVEHVVGMLAHFTESVAEICIRAHPRDLYKPVDELSAGPDPNGTHELLDRVVCVRSNYLVPLGSRGTIIGLVKSGPRCFWVYDILFDKYAKEGQRKIIRMSSRDFINFDNGIRLRLEVSSWEASKPDKSKPEVWQRGCFIGETGK